MFLGKVTSIFVVAFCFSFSSFANSEDIVAEVMKGESLAFVKRGADLPPSLVNYAYLGSTGGLFVADGQNGISIDLDTLPFYQYHYSGRNYCVAYAPGLISTGGIFEVKIIDNSSDYEYKVDRSQIQEASAYALEVVKADVSSMKVDYFSLPESVSDSIVSASLPLEGASTDILRWVSESANFSQPFESSLNSKGRKAKALSDSDVKRAFHLSGVKKSAISNQTTNFLYDQYANTNSSIIAYSTSAAGRGGHLMSETEGNAIFVTDDNIVNIIPRNLLTISGSCCFMGSEYGFYVNTYASGNYITSNILVFDITNTPPVASTPGSIIVTPILNGFTDYDQTYNVVHWNSSSSSNLAIGNIFATVGIGNVSHPNIGDSGYYGPDDYGYYCTSYCVSEKGVAENGDYNGLATPDGQWLLELINFGISEIPYIGTAMSVVADIGYASVEGKYYHDLLSNHNGLQLAADGSYTTGNLVMANSNSYTAISDWGNLPKTFRFGLSKHDGTQETASDPLLYKTNSDTFKVNYATSQQYSKINWDAYLLTSISLNIFNDNTWSFLGFYWGSLDLEATMQNSWARIFNLEPEPSSVSMLAGTPYYSQYCSTAFAADMYGGKDNDYQEYSFTPTKSGTYLFQTYGTDFDTLLSIFDFSMKLLASDDNSGTYVNSFSQRRCSLISQWLSGGNVYKIRVKGFNGMDGATYIRADEFCGAIYENGRNFVSPTIFSGAGTEEKCYAFSPAESGEYSVFTSRFLASADTVLNVFDDAFNRVCFNDDEGNGTGRLFSQAECYMIAGRTYYIFVREYAGSSSTTFQFRVNVTTLESLSNAGAVLETDFCQGYIIQGGSTSLYFSFIPSRDATYSFWTTFVDLNWQDLTMRILDADMNQLAYDDDSAGHLQPKILNFSFSARTKYYILIEKYSASNTTGAFFEFCCQ